MFSNCNMILKCLIGSSIPSSIPSVHKRGGNLNNRPPLRRKRSSRNGKPRLSPYNNGSLMHPNNGSNLSGNIRRGELNIHPHFGRRTSELGSVADESLTSCTGPISQDDSDFSSFNLNSASMGASSKNFKKDGYNLPFITFEYNHLSYNYKIREYPIYSL